MPKKKLSVSNFVLKKSVKFDGDKPDRKRKSVTTPQLKPKRVIAIHQTGIDRSVIKVKHPTGQTWLSCWLVFWKIFLTQINQDRQKFVKKYQRLLAIILAILGINLIIGGALYLSYRRTILSFQVSPIITATTNVRPSEPSHIKINHNPIDLPITPAFIVDGIWETSQEAATHLATSARPGEGSNIIVYGHNLNRLFGPLTKVKIGDQVEITTIDGHQFLYQVQEIKQVKPSEIELVTPTDYEVLTLYTCVGFLDSQRLVIRAFPVKVSTG